MTSRERVLKTVNHIEPDKLPLDLGGMASTGIMATAYNELKRNLGIGNKITRVSDIYQQIALIEKEVLDHYDVDVISLEHCYMQDSNDWIEWDSPYNGVVEINKNSNVPQKRDNKWVLMDGERVKAHMPESCLYFEPINPPLEYASSKNEILKHNWNYYSDEHFRKLENRAKMLFEETDYAIIGNFAASIFEESHALRGYSNFMLDLVADPDFVGELTEKITEVHLTNLEKYLQAVSKYIQIIQMGDDLGMQSGPQISLDVYKESIKPSHKKIYQTVKEKSDLFVFFHSCGAVYEFIPDLIDAGVDILNPIQFTASNMNTKKLKEEFGKQITFWGGGIDTQHVLQFGTPEEIDNQVKEQIDILSPGGGFVFATVHNIQANVPPENIIALFNAIKKYRT